MVEHLRKRPWILYLLVFGIALFIHFNIKLGVADDVFFRKKGIEYGVMNFINMRYQSWTSRIFIETIMVTLLQMPELVWIILDSLMYVLIYFSINRILNKLNLIKTKVIIVILMFLFPFKYFGTAGWYATTINYLWPLALGLYSLSVCLKFYNNERVKKHEYIFLLVAVIFSTNQEQMGALILGYLVILILFNFVNHKTVSKELLFLLVIVTGMFIFNMTCPGNSLRTISETKTWYPEYKDFSIFNKVTLGYLSTFSVLLTARNTMYYIFIILIPIFVIKKSNNKMDIFISVIPFIINLVIQCSRLLPNIPVIREIYNSVVIYKDGIGYIDYFSSSLFMTLAISIVLICIILYILFKYSSSFFIVFIIISSGILSRIIIGFSPTVFASGIRTSIFLYYAILVVNVILINELLLQHSKSKFNGNVNF